MERVEAHRAVATFHSFRFFDLVFLPPGFVGPNPAGGLRCAGGLRRLRHGIARHPRWTVRLRFLIWAFNVVGLADLVMDTVNAVSMDLPSVAGQLGAGYALPILYVPALFWTHLLAFFLLLRPARTPARSAGAPRPLAATEQPGTACIRWAE